MKELSPQRQKINFVLFLIIYINNVITYYRTNTLTVTEKKCFESRITNIYFLPCVQALHAKMIVFSTFCIQKRRRGK